MGIKEAWYAFIRWISTPTATENVLQEYLQNIPCSEVSEDYDVSGPFSGDI